mmetsp:Transcript_22681/g.38496  ORF Transcript_22681/g.38496 Transcript_22681/m.38496 type:complete len:237 (-) Transcript_22681:573-1283(-)
MTDSRRRKSKPIRSLPVSAPLNWSGFGQSFWDSTIYDYISNRKRPRKIKMHQLLSTSRSSSPNKSATNDSKSEDDSSTHSTNDKPLHSSASNSTQTPSQHVTVTKTTREVLTDLQKLIIMAIKHHSGMASTEDVEEFVSKYWGNLRKRDGTPYSYDCRRVVIASLANTSNPRPLFQRVQPERDIWQLGDRITEFLPEELLYVPKQLPDPSTISTLAATRTKRKRKKSNELSEFGFD